MNYTVSFSINKCWKYCWRCMVWVREELLFKLQTLYTSKNFRFISSLFFLGFILILLLLYLKSRRRRYFLFYSNCEQRTFICDDHRCEYQHRSTRHIVSVSAFGDFWKSTETDYVSSRCRRYRFYVRVFLFVCVHTSHIPAKQTLAPVCSQQPSMSPVNGLSAC